LGIKEKDVKKARDGPGASAVGSARYMCKNIHKLLRRRASSPLSPTSDESENIHIKCVLVNTIRIKPEPWKRPVFRYEKAGAPDALD
jgi:hypothetical protein